MEEIDVIKKVCRNVDPECEIFEEKEDELITGIKIIFKSKVSVLSISSRLGLNRVVVTNKIGPTIISEGKLVISGTTFKNGLIDYYIDRKTSKLFGVQYVVA